jgi:hypothetical protein
MTGTAMITTIGLTWLILYIIIQILNFYGVGQDVYGIYLAFIVFMILNSFVLPTKNAQL